MKTIKRNQINFYDFGDIEMVSGVCRHTFPYHIHKSLCFGVIIDGRAEFVFENRKSILKQGDFYIVPPFTRHSISAINKEEYSYVTICIKNRNYKGLALSQHIKKEKDYITIARLFIENNITAPFSLQVLSDYVHISEFHLIREFKEQIGLSPYQYYLNVKIKNIRQGLLEKQSLSDLALTFGFSDQSHLCNTFKKFTGITPLQFNNVYQSFSSRP